MLLLVSMLDQCHLSLSHAMLNMQDPVWSKIHDQMLEFNSQLAKTCTQNPLEYRKVALAAIKLSSRPHDLGVDVNQAAEMCSKMMS